MEKERGIMMLKETLGYYTPELEEFHMGFEYEMYIPGTNFLYSKEVFRPLLVNGVVNTFDRGLQKGWLRVKCFDKDDVTNLGYPLDEWFPGKGKYGGTYMIHVTPSMRITVSIKDIMRNGSGDFKKLDIIYRLKLKNKSELKKLLKQLGI